jgi:hypothetical protein
MPEKPTSFPATGLSILSITQEIKQLEAEVLEMRKTINPSKMKPKPLPPKEPTL